MVAAPIGVRGAINPTLPTKPALSAAFSFEIPAFMLSLYSIAAFTTSKLDPAKRPRGPNQLGIPIFSKTPT